jgi:hypothetical protein
VRRCRFVLVLSLILFGASEPARAFRIADIGPALGVRNPVHLRWDAAPRTVGEEERSLDGGLRYSMEGGSYEGFRDQFQWSDVPSAEAFRGAVEAAFAAWESVDPATGLGTSLEFVADLDTEIWDDPGNPQIPGSFTGVNYGAEIDLIAETPHLGPAYGASVVFFVDLSSAGRLSLTSGTTNYDGIALSGADIRINPALVYTLDFFQILLTHEIGHAIGITDAEIYPGLQLAINSPFFDDDFDGTSSATALATLTNSFALEIDPYDPDSTPLLRIADDLFEDPGLLTPGVDLLMESNLNTALGSRNPVLQHDDFAARQFLYPFLLPEPGLSVMVALAGAAGLALRRGR